MPENAQVEISEVNHASNMKSSAAAEKRRVLQSLRDYPVKKSINMSPTMVNAAYHVLFNRMVVPAGILQPPLFKGSSSRALNYGSIGSMIGHEITHGFDDQGRHFDKEGHVIKWWSDGAISEFQERTMCFENQYDAYCPLLQFNRSICVDGRDTLGENIADNGGLKAGYKAYRKWVSEHKEEQKLPGLEYTPDQLYFLGFAQDFHKVYLIHSLKEISEESIQFFVKKQVWCVNIHPQHLLKVLLKDEHSPSKYRVLGAISNSKEFAEAFNCPISSPMNRGNGRCELW